MLGEEAGEFEGFLDGEDDGLFGEDLHARFQAKADLVEVEDVRREDAVEVGIDVREHRFDGRVSGGVFTDHVKMGGLGVVVADDLGFRHFLAKRGQDMTGPQADA